MKKSRRMRIANVNKKGILVRERYVKITTGSGSNRQPKVDSKQLHPMPIVASRQNWECHNQEIAS